MKKTVIGLSFIALAGYLLFGKSLHMPQLDISPWLLIGIVGFALATIQSFLHKNWLSSYICGVVTFILLNTHFDWLKVSNGMIIFASVLAWIGLQFIFNGKGKSVIFNDHLNVREKKPFYRLKNHDSDIVFASNTCYVNGDITEFSGDVVFGSCVLYFDNANLPLGHAIFSGDVVFSSVKLYVPCDWTVEFTGDRVFSSVKLKPNHVISTNQLYVTGSFVFSSLEVIYI